MLCMHYIKKDRFGLVCNRSLISISMVRTETASWPTSAGPRPQSSPKCDQSGPVLRLSSVLGLDLKTLLAVHGLMIIQDPTHLTKGVVICGEVLCLTKSKYLLISIGLPVPPHEHVQTEQVLPQLLPHASYQNPLHPMPQDRSGSRWQCLR